MLTQPMTFLAPLILGHGVPSTCGLDCFVLKHFENRFADIGYHSRTLLLKLSFHNTTIKINLYFIHLKLYFRLQVNQIYKSEN
jgi:hypothetical protein